MNETAAAYPTILAETSPPVPGEWEFVVCQPELNPTPMAPNVRDASSRTDVEYYSRYRTRYTMAAYPFNHRHA